MKKRKSYNKEMSFTKAFARAHLLDPPLSLANLVEANETIVYLVTSEDCAHCREYKADAERMRQFHKKNNFQVVIEVDVDERTEEGRTFREVALRDGVRSIPSYVECTGGEVKRILAPS